MAGTDVLSMSGSVASVSWVRVRLSGMRRYILRVGGGWVNVEGKRGRGREGGREEGGKRIQNSRLVSYPCIIQKENGELGKVVDMDGVEIVYACSAE